MRVAPYLLSAILLAAMFGTTHAAPASIEGAWSGSGIVKIRNRTDRIVCRVNFDKIAQTSYRVSARLFRRRPPLRADRTRVARRAAIAIAVTSTTPNSTRGVM